MEKNIHVYSCFVCPPLTPLSLVITSECQKNWRPILLEYVRMIYRDSMGPYGTKMDQSNPAHSVFNPICSN